MSDTRGRKNSTCNDINNTAEDCFVSLPNGTVLFFSKFPCIFHTFLCMYYTSILLLHMYYSNAI